ncbi:hypothetical protein [Sphingobacterium anhuiense]|uniref:YD repeat-containing protein n=1 Tax=Sphingobacterium anhuiense TaxID=493780 RepID=A0ABW5YVJ1_9SPHI
MLPRVVNASPEATSLGKYGFWPVSYYTGVPDISIPIYNITIGDFSLPITVRYHASGVKVDDISSWVGVNWSLSAGGMIGRTVIGRPDDEGAGGYAHQVKTGLRFKETFNLRVPEDYHILKESSAYSDALRETESDIHYYNFAGFSGRFLMDSTFNIRTIPVSNLKFIYSPFSVLKQENIPPLATGVPDEAYVIADDKGNIYKFTNLEVTRAGIGIADSPEGGRDFTSGYYLSQIILANRVDTINFEYGLKKEIYVLAPVHSYKEIPNEPLLPLLSNTSYSALLGAKVVLYNGKEGGSYAPRKHYTNGQTVLKKISWRNGQVMFYSNTIREDMDLNTGHMLDSVKVYDVDGKLITNYGFNYSYIGKRYYLSSLIESGNANNIKPYYFEYDKAGQLPYRNFTTNYLYYCPQDHWGYFNGASASKNLLPPNTNFTEMSVGKLVGNREPNPDYAAFGTLSKITFPTRGYTEFKYEGNRYDPSTVANESGPNQPIVDVVKNVTGSKTVPFSRSISFTVPFDQFNGRLKLRIYNYSKPPGKGNFHLPYVRIKRGSTNVYYNDAFDTFPTTAPSPNPDGSHSYEFNISNVQLFQGDYTLIVSDTCLTTVSCMDAPDPRVAYMEATLTYNGYGDPPDPGNTPPPFGGGLRVKEIANYSSDGKLADKKNYQYNPGHLIAYPSDYTRYYQLFVNDLVSQYSGIAKGEAVADITETSSTPQTILGLTQGSTVGYTKVKEQQVNEFGEGLGYVNYHYSFFRDTLSPLIFDVALQGKYRVLGATVPPNSVDYKRGLLLSKSIYKRQIGGQYVQIDSLLNSYDFFGENYGSLYYKQKNLRVNKLRIGEWQNIKIVQGYIWPAIEWMDTFTDFSYAYYDVVSDWIPLMSSEEIKYDQNGANPVKTVTNYQYNTKNLLPSQVTTVNSGGDKTVTRITYPVDYIITGTSNNDIARGINNLKQQYITAAPVEYTVSKENSNGSNKRTLSSTLYTYKPAIARPSAVFATNSINPITNFAPVSILSGASVMDSRYENKSLFQQYDQYGNIIELKEKAGVTVCYIWGYKGQYPIAEIKNATYSDVLTKLGGQTVLNQLNSSSVTEAFIAQKMEALRTALPAAHITSYTYQPLIGMRSKTDPRGVTEYYEYDGMQRLKAVLDQFKNVISALDYHYRPN